MDRAPAHPPRSSRAAEWLALSCVALVALAAHAWTLALPFQLDDHLLLRDPAALFRASSRFAERDIGMPEPRMMRWTVWSAWTLLDQCFTAPLSPRIYHAIGLCLHALSSVLLAVCAMRVCGERLCPRAPWLPGLVAGAAFAASAGAVEAFAWTAAWGDSLALSFACLALLALLRARGAVDGARASARAVWFVLGGACAFLALLSKESALVLPSVVALALWICAEAAREAPDRADAANPRARWFFPRAEWIALAVTFAAFLLLRVYVLGGLHLSAETGSASPLEYAQRTLPVLRGFVQALYPHNQAAEFADCAPLASRWHLDVLVYFAWGLPLVSAAFTSRASLKIGVLAAMAIGLALAPTALIATGARTNALSRAEYVSLALAWVSWTAALLRMWNLRGAGARGARWLAGACVLVQVLATLDLRAHVVATQEYAAEQIHALDTCVAEARAEHARSGQRLPLAIVCITGEPGLGDIPVLGEHARFRYGPPFEPAAPMREPARAGPGSGELAEAGGAAEPGESGSSGASNARASDARTWFTLAHGANALGVLAFGTRAEAERDWPTRELGARDLAWIESSGDVLALRARGARGRELRAAALPRARAALVQGLSEARRDALTFRPEPAPSSPKAMPRSGAPQGGLRYVPSALIPVHALGALELAFAPGPAIELELVLEAGKQQLRHAFSLRASELEVRRVALATMPDLARMFGPPIHAFAIEARAPAAADEASSSAPRTTPAAVPALVYEPKLLPDPPEYEVLEPRAQQAIELDAAHAPAITLGRVPPLAAELDLRAEFWLELPVGRIAIIGVAPATALQPLAARPGEAAGAVRAELREFRFDAWPPEVPSLPWREFCAHVLIPELKRRNRSELAATSRVVLALRGSDLIAGTSTWRAVALRL